MEQTSMFRATAHAAPVVVPGDPQGLRYYQREAVDLTLDALKTHRGVLVVIFMSGGKTRTGATLAHSLPGRGLWLAERDYLIDDARVELESLTRELVSVEKADQRSDGTRIVVGSVQTLRGRRLESFARDSFQWIVFDEAQHSVAPGARAIFEHFGQAKIIGLTATPQRLDKVGLHNVYSHTSIIRDIAWGMDNAFFCPVVPIARNIQSIDLSKVATVAGDLKLSDLEAQIVKSAASIAHIALEESENGKLPSLIYTPGVASAHAVCRTWNEILPGTCAVMDADTDKAARRKMRKAFDAGELRALANCLVLTEGFNAWKARVIIQGRLTKSVSLYQQIAGRGGRLEPGIGELPTIADRFAAIAASSKPSFKLVDITGHAGRHKLITALDALAGKDVTDAELKEAKKLAAAKPGTPLDEAIRLAKAAERKRVADELEAEASKLAKAAARAAVKATRGTFDPFKRLGADITAGNEPAWLRTPPTADQVIWCRTNGICRKDALPPKELTRGAVAKLQRQANEWRRQGMANFKQRKLLANAGLPVDVRFSVASDVIDVLIKNGFHANRSRAKCLEIINGYEPGAEI